MYEYDGAVYVLTEEDEIEEVEDWVVVGEVYDETGAV